MAAMHTCEISRLLYSVITRSGESISGVNPIGVRARTAADVIAAAHGTWPNSEKINPIRLAPDHCNYVRSVNAASAPMNERVCFLSRESVKLPN